MLSHYFIQITTDFREFTSKNKMAGMAKGGEVSLAEMSEALRSMPQFKTQVSQMSLHLAMCGRCFELQPDQEIGMLEQNMAMGEDENGKTFSDAVNSIMKVYRTPPPKFNDEQKLRLLLICCISQNGLSESERAKLFKMSGLETARDTSAAAVMANLSNLGIQLQKQKARIFQRSKKTERRKVGGSAAPDWALFRFRPQNYFICQDVIDGKLRFVPEICPRMRRLESQALRRSREVQCRGVSRDQSGNFRRRKWWRCSSCWAERPKAQACMELVWNGYQPSSLAPNTSPAGCQETKSIA